MQFMSHHTKLPEPLVSVIIPTYNRPDYLRQAIASAVQQTYQNLEIIVSDNCSLANPLAIVESFQDPRIRFWRHPQNVGMIANQLTAFKMARGKYVASLHDDDLWNQDFLAKLVPPLEADSQLILAFCDQYIIDAQGKINVVGTEENTRSYKRDQLGAGIHQSFAKIGLVDKSIATAAACVIRNHIVDWDSIPAESGGMWDLYLTYLCYKSGFAIYYHPERLTQYRAHEQTDTMLSGSRDVHAKLRKAQAEMFCYKKLIEDQTLAEFQPYFQQQWLTANTSFGIGLLRLQQTAEARHYLWRAFNKQKLNLRTITALTLSFTPRILANKLLGT
jgi:glycosyltransferase involved in cell wall biosynthesis